MSGFKRAQRHHVQVIMEALKFDGSCAGPIFSSMGRVVGGDLTRFEIQNVNLFLADGCEISKTASTSFILKNRLVRDLNGALNRGHGSAEDLSLLQKGIEFVRPCRGGNQPK